MEHTQQRVGRVEFLSIQVEFDGKVAVVPGTGVAVGALGVGPGGIDGRRIAGVTLDHVDVLVFALTVEELLENLHVVVGVLFRVVRVIGRLRQRLFLLVVDLLLELAAPHTGGGSQLLGPGACDDLLPFVGPLVGPLAPIDRNIRVVRTLCVSIEMIVSGCLLELLGQLGGEQSGNLRLQVPLGLRDGRQGLDQDGRPAESVAQGLVHAPKLDPQRRAERFQSVDKWIALPIVLRPVQADSPPGKPEVAEQHRLEAGHGVCHRLDHLQVLAVHQNLLDGVDHSLCRLGRSQQRQEAVLSGLAGGTHSTRRSTGRATSSAVRSASQVRVHVLEDTRCVDLVRRHGAIQDELDEPAHGGQGPLVIVGGRRDRLAQRPQGQHAFRLVITGDATLSHVLAERAAQDPVGEPHVRRRQVPLGLAECKERLLGLPHLVHDPLAQQDLLQIRFLLEHNRHELEAAQRPRVVGRLEEPDHKDRHGELGNQLGQARRGRVEKDLVDNRQHPHLRVPGQRRELQVEQGVQQHGRDGVQAALARLGDVDDLDDLDRLDRLGGFGDLGSLALGLGGGSAAPLIEELGPHRLEVLWAGRVANHQALCLEGFHFPLGLGPVKDAEIRREHRRQHVIDQRQEDEHLVLVARLEVLERPHHPAHACGLGLSRQERQDIGRDARRLLVQQPLRKLDGCRRVRRHEPRQGVEHTRLDGDIGATDGHQAPEDHLHAVDVDHGLDRDLRETAALGDRRQSLKGGKGDLVVRGRGQLEEAGDGRSEQRGERFQGAVLVAGDMVPVAGCHGAADVRSGGNGDPLHADLEKVDERQDGVQDVPVAGVQQQAGVALAYFPQRLNALLGEIDVLDAEKLLAEHADAPVLAYEPRRRRVDVEEEGDDPGGQQHHVRVVTLLQLLEEQGNDAIGRKRHYRLLGRDRDVLAELREARELLAWVAAVLYHVDQSVDLLALTRGGTMGEREPMRVV